MGDNFDEMSNDQLRLKLLELGMANMPVTNTTRKVLIKKLRNHSSNGSGTANARRTLNLAKYSSDEDSEPVASGASKKVSSKKEATNRRATIAGTSVKPAKPLPKPQPAPKPVVSVAPPAEPAATSKRRSGRITPVLDKADAPASLHPNVSIILEDSDDDMVPLTQLARGNRKSKSPSLSRAEMLTTSYVHQMEVLKEPTPEPVVEQMDIDLTEAAKNTDSTDYIMLEDDDEENNANGLTSMPPPQQTLSQPVKESHVSYTTSHSDTRRTIATTTMDERRTEDNFLEPSTAKYRTSERTYPSSSITSGFSRGGVSTPVRKEAQPQVKYDSPYLSEFTRRLSQLRAEANQPHTVDGARDIPMRRTMVDVSSTAHRVAYGKMRDEYEPPSARYRKTLATGTVSKQADVGVGSSMRKNLIALDRMYSIRKILFSILVVLLVIFLYVFFFL